MHLCSYYARLILVSSSSIGIMKLSCPTCARLLNPESRSSPSIPNSPILSSLTGATATPFCEKATNHRQINLADDPCAVQMKDSQKSSPKSHGCLLADSTLTTSNRSAVVFVFVCLFLSHPKHLDISQVYRATGSSLLHAPTGTLPTNLFPYLSIPSSRTSTYTRAQHHHLAAFTRTADDNDG